MSEHGLDIAGVLSEHRQFGGGCTGCDWLTGNPALSLKDDHSAHVAAVLRGHVDAALLEAKAAGWDERSEARPQYLGPNDGHYADCMGWEDCWCASYPNPYRAASKGRR
jgi:hypothetical protein